MPEARRRPNRPRRRAAEALVVAGVLLGAGGLAACSSGTSTRSAASTTVARPSGLPPVGHAALTAVVSPILDRFDDSVERVELTTDPTPDHHVLLSLYAKPNHARTPDQYAAQMAPLAKAVIPVLLGRYPGLYAVDLCQEEQHPPADVYEPPPITRVYLARPRLGDITWSALDLAAIRAQAHGSDPAMQLYVDPSVAKSTTFQAAKPAT